MKRLYLFFSTYLKEVISGLKGSNSFVRNVAYNLSGNTVVLIIGFFLTPIIATIYGPEAYGSFAVFAAICGIFQPVSSFQLPNGYVAARTRFEFYTLIRLSFYTLITTSFIFFILLLVYAQFENPILPNRLLNLIPFYVLFAGIFAILRGWNIKLLEFKKAAKARVLGTVIGKITTGSFGFFLSTSPLGLVLGSIVAFLTESVSLVSKKLLIEAKIIYRIKISRKDIWSTLIKYKQYPTYVTFNSIINSLSNQIPIYFLAAFYTKDKVGLYSLAASLLLIPINLTGTSMASVFLPKISAVIEDKSVRNSLVLKLYTKITYPTMLALVGLGLFLGLFLTSLLGDDWFLTAQISSFIAVSFSFTIISVPLSVIFRLIHLEKFNLNITVVFVFIKLLSLWVGWYIGGFIFSVFAYFLANILHQGMQMIILFKKLEIKYLMVVRDLLILSFLYTLAFYLVKT